MPSQILSNLPNFEWSMQSSIAEIGLQFLLDFGIVWEFGLFGWTGIHLYARVRQNPGLIVPKSTQLSRIDCVWDSHCFTKQSPFIYIYLKNWMFHFISYLWSLWLNSFHSCRILVEAQRRSDVFTSKAPKGMKSGSETTDKKNVETWRCEISGLYFWNDVEVALGQGRRPKKKEVLPRTGSPYLQSKFLTKWTWPRRVSRIKSGQLQLTITGFQHSGL